MARIVSPGTTKSASGGQFLRRPFFVSHLIRRHGLRGVAALIVAAVFAFAPLTMLYWFNALRLQSVVNSTVGSRPVVVKPGQYHEEQEREEPGETALLQVTCDVPSVDGWRELLIDGDPAGSGSSSFRSQYVRNERVYLRRAGSSQVPFGLLGRPPVSVWLPAGDYEVLAVHEAPSHEPRIDLPGRSFPLLSVFAECSLESRQKTVCRVQLPHYNWGNVDALLTVGTLEESSDRKPSPDELAPLLADCGRTMAIPTPAGYVLNLLEPQVHHRDGHRGCVEDFYDQISVPREWTRDQLAQLRSWLPDDAVAARTRLTDLVDKLGWRQFVEGWLCYALAGVSGLVFTRRGAIALVDPWRRGDGWSDWFALLVKILLVSVVAWLALEILTSVLRSREFSRFLTH